jgi:hypothetical protein
MCQIIVENGLILLLILLLMVNTVIVSGLLVTKGGK